MIGSIRWNLALGLFGCILTFILSISDNIFSTAFRHGLYCGFILFMVAFMFRWFLGTLLFAVPIETHIGNNLDMVTPDELDEIHLLMRNENENEIDAEESDFKPLNPPKLVSKRVTDPEEMVKALRHMSED
jgi:hypothetical protein